MKNKFFFEKKIQLFVFIDFELNKMNQTFLLSAAGLSRDVLPSDFTFFVGNHEYYTNKSNASFISENISEILRVDPTFDSYYLPIDDSHYEFNIIMRLMLGQPIKITAPTIKYVLSVFQKLKNSEITNYFINIKNSKLTQENVLASFAARLYYGQSVSNEIIFIASNFSNFLNELKDDFYFDYIEDIISSPHLNLESEDILFDFIIDLGPDFYNLLDYVNIQYLTPQKLNEFFDIYPFRRMTQNIWDSLHQIIKNKNDNFSNNNLIEFKTQEFPLSNNPFNGIFAYFWEKCQGNPHLKGSLTVSSSSSCRNNDYDVINPAFNGYWFSANEPNSWIMFDFQKYSLQLKNYTIKSDGNGANHLQSWVIEGSNDNKNWTLIDRKSTKALCENYVIKTFQCNVKNSSSYRFVRLKQIGENSNYLNYLMISNIEFFGTLELIQ